MGILEVLFRLAPASIRIYDTGEREVRYRRPGEAFERNFHTERTGHGDLIRIGNLTQTEERRKSIFTTDDWGFRNVGLTYPIAAVVFGDSYTYANDKNEETLPMQLGQIAGCSIYNAAGPEMAFQRPNGALVRSVIDRVGISGGTVIIEAVEGYLFERHTGTSPSWARSHVPGFWRLQDLARQTREVIEDTRKFIGRSPFEILAERATRTLKNDKILPNSYADNVVAAKLQNGDRMIFYYREMETYEKQWPLQTSYWIQLAEELKNARLKLLIVLVPNKFTVYHRMLVTKPEVMAEPGELLTRFETELRSKGLAVVNLTNALRLDAERNAPHRIYNYYREDTHWNERGIRIAAAELSRTVPDLQWTCASQ